MSAETEAKWVEQNGSRRRFFPDFALLEAVVALVVLVALVLLAAFTKPPLQAVASPNSAGYVPRPEWYFLWLFQLLKYFKGSLEAVGTALVPTVIVALMVALPFLDRRQNRGRGACCRGRGRSGCGRASWRRRSSPCCWRPRCSPPPRRRPPSRPRRPCRRPVGPCMRRRRSRPWRSRSGGTAHCQEKGL